MTHSNMSFDTIELVPYRFVTNYYRAAFLQIISMNKSWIFISYTCQTSQIHRLSTQFIMIFRLLYRFCFLWAGNNILSDLMSFSSNQGVIYKPCGQFFGFFWPPPPPLWTNMDILGTLLSVHVAFSMTSPPSARVCQMCQNLEIARYPVKFP